MPATGENRTPRTLKKGWDEKFLTALEELGAVAPAARQAGVGRSTVYDRRDADPVFRAAMEQALDTCVEEVESTLYTRAKSGETDTAVIFYLKSRKPEIYGDKLRHEEREKIKREAREEALAEVQERIRALPPAMRKQLMRDTG